MYARDFQSNTVPRLRRQMHNHIRRKLHHRLLQRRKIPDIHFQRRKAFILRQHCMTSFLQVHVIVIRQAIHPQNLPPLPQHQLRQMKPNKPRTACNQNPAHNSTLCPF